MANQYTIIKKYKSLELLRFDEPINGGFYAVRCTKARKAKIGLSLDAAADLFFSCIKPPESHNLVPKI